MFICPICRANAQETTNQQERDRATISVSCDICGEFAISHEARDELAPTHERWNKIRPKISAYTKERTIHSRPKITITETPVEEERPFPHLSISEIVDRFPTSMSERYDRVLKNLVKLSAHPGSTMTVSNRDYSTFFSEIVGFDVMYLITDQLVADGYIEIARDYSRAMREIKVTVKGWHRVEELEKVNPESTQCFIAMSFAKDMDEIAVHGFEQAIQAAGYKPLRLDRKEHNDKIDDQIIAEIRSSKFVVADFTNNSGGAYFEAGFALGLGLPVIWTVREDQEKAVHFDTRQYNHILWKDAEDLRFKLINRIKATIV